MCHFHTRHSQGCEFFFDFPVFSLQGKNQEKNREFLQGNTGKNQENTGNFAIKQGKNKEKTGKNKDKKGKKKTRRRRRRFWGGKSPQSLRKQRSVADAKTCVRRVCGSKGGFMVVIHLCMTVHSFKGLNPCLGTTCSAFATCAHSKSFPALQRVFVLN